MQLNPDVNNSAKQKGQEKNCGGGRYRDEYFHRLYCRNGGCYGWYDKVMFIIK